MIVTSDCGLYEYRLPLGHNVKLVNNKPSSHITRSATNQLNPVISSSTYPKSKPLKDDEMLDEIECIDVLYATEPISEDSCDIKRKDNDPLRTESDSKEMQIKPVRTNKFRLGYTLTSKTKINEITTVPNANAEKNTGKENTLTNRPPTMKKCEICGNTYKHPHILER